MKCFMLQLSHDLTLLLVYTNIFSLEFLTSLNRFSQYLAKCPHFFPIDGASLLSKRKYKTNGNFFFEHPNRKHSFLLRGEKK